MVDLKSMARGATTILCGVLALAATVGEDFAAERGGEVHAPTDGERSIGPFKSFVSKSGAPHDHCGP
jgi:hypothetical protein